MGRPACRECRLERGLVGAAACHLGRLGGHALGPSRSTHPSRAPQLPRPQRQHTALPPACANVADSAPSTTQVDQSSVREALHVPATSNFFDGDNGAGMIYQSTEPDLRPFYQHVANSTALRVIVYNGDTDPAINSFVAQAQIHAAVALASSARHPPLGRAHVIGCAYLYARALTSLAYHLPLSCRTGPRTSALQPRSRGVRGPSTAAAVWVAT